MALKIVKPSSAAPSREQLVFSAQRAFASGELEKAAELMLQALELQERDPGLLVQLGVVLYQLEKFDKAVVALRTALELDPYLVDGLNALGVVFFRLEWFAVAELFFRRVLELDPEHASARMSLVEAMRRVRDTGDTVSPDLAAITALAAPAEPRLSVCMIVKNEEAFLAGCLDSVQGLADELIVVDTGSTDATVAIAEAHGAKVFHTSWTGDFAAARNVSLEHATGDWILVLDADERLDPVTRVALRRLMAHREVVGYSLLIENKLGEEGSQARQMATVFRMFRNRPDVRFEGRIHEQVILSAQRTGLKTHACDLKITHLGYTSNWMQDRDKLNRNLGILREQLAEEDDNPYVHHNLGQTLKMMERYDEAAQHYERSLALLKEQAAGHNIPYYSNLYFALADLFRITGQFDRAHALLDEGLGIYPAFAELIYTKAFTYLDQERYQDAIACYERCLRLAGTVNAGGTDPSLTGHKSLNAMGICYAKLGDTAMARSYLAQAVEAHPDPDPDLRTNLGILLAQDGDTARAVLQFVAALEKNPRELRAWINLASIYHRLGQFQEAIEAWTKALELDPTIPEARIMLAEAHLRQGEAAAALAVLATEQEARPDSKLVWLDTGLARLQLGEVEAARAAWLRAGEEATSQALVALVGVLAGGELVATGSELTRAWVLGATHLLLGRQEELLQGMLERLSELAPLAPGLELGLGQLFYHHGLHALAIDMLVLAQERAPEHADVYVGLADACLATGNLEDARIMYARASELAPAAMYPRRQLQSLGTLQAVAI